MNGENEIESINAFVLAGGGSRRFGGDKALSTFRGAPLVSHVADSLEAYFGDVTLIVKDKNRYRHLGYSVIEDAVPYQTPLAGIYTGLTYSESDWNFFAACDMPLLNHDVFERLNSALQEEGMQYEIVTSRTQQGIQPLAGFYHISLADVIMDLQDRIRSLRGFIRNCDSLIVDFKHSTHFSNVNTRKQLENLDR